MTMTTETTAARRSFLENLKMADLLDIYNTITDGHVKRFASRAKGIERTLRNAEKKPEVGERLDRYVAAAGGLPVKGEDVTLDDLKNDDHTKPLPTAGQVLAEIAEKEAEKLETRTVKGAELVVVGGRMVRRENVGKIKRGEALWGNLSGEVSEKDRMRGTEQDINFNYALKDKVVIARKGTDRAKLVEMMRKGTTVKEVMKQFQIERDPAIYKMREMHYCGGYGMEVRGGKVYVIEPEAGK